VAPRSVIHHMAVLLSHTVSCVPEFIQYAAIDALTQWENKSGKVYEQVLGMIHQYQHRRDFVVEWLNKIPGVSCQVPGGTFYVYPNFTKALPAGVGSDVFCDYLLEEKDVGIMDGSQYSENNKGCIRISVASNDESLKEALRRIERAILDIKEKGFTWKPKHNC